MAALTYAGRAGAISQAWDAMLKTGGLKKRELPPTPLQMQMREHILNLWRKWDDAEAKLIGSMNLLLDAPGEQRKSEIQKLKNEMAECRVAGTAPHGGGRRRRGYRTSPEATAGRVFLYTPSPPPHSAPRSRSHLT